MENAETELRKSLGKIAITGSPPSQYTGFLKKDDQGFYISTEEHGDHRLSPGDEVTVSNPGGIGIIMLGLKTYKL